MLDVGSWTQCFLWAECRSLEIVFEAIEQVLGGWHLSGRLAHEARTFRVLLAESGKLIGFTRCPPSDASGTARSLLIRHLLQKRRVSRHLLP
jgi:hypothetical protein